MISLIRSEIRRCASRRVMRMTAVIVLGITLLVLGRVFMLARSEPGPGLAEATQSAAQVKAQCEAHSENPKECADITPAMFFNDPRLHARDALPDGTTAVAVGVAIFAFAIGASYVGADWGAGTMQALLFWEPRRGRVLFAKALALVVVVAAFLVALWAVVYAALLLTASVRGTLDGVTAGLHMSNLLTLLRGMVVVSFSALFGFAVAGLARHSGAALFGGFGYFVIVENLIRGLRPGWQRFLIGENYNAILAKNVEVATASGRSLFAEDGARLYLLTGVRGAVTLGIYLVLVLGAFYLAFTRRDVT